MSRWWEEEKSPEWLTKLSRERAITDLKNGGYGYCNGPALYREATILGSKKGNHRKKHLRQLNRKN